MLVEVPVLSWTLGLSDRPIGDCVDELKTWMDMKVAS